MRRFTTLIVMAAMVGMPVAASAQDLSPRHWPEAERLALERREAAIWPTETRKAEGTKGLVTGTASPVAVHAGVEALRQGGTAADAAIATALTQVTMMAGANVSFAGVVQLVYFEKRTGRVFVLDAGWGSWRGETSPATIPQSDISAITGKAPATVSAAAGRKALVPGFMAGMQAIHDRFGRLPFARLFDPAIWYAEHGVPVTPLLGSYLTMARPILDTTPEGHAFAAGPDHRLAPPSLAATLKAVAAEGARFMYRGAWARHYVDAVRARGGAATMADMAAYAPSWGEPMRLGLSGATLFGPAEDNSSGCAILMALNLLDHRPETGRYWEDPAAFATMARALRLSIFAPYAPGVAAFEKRTGLGGSCAARLTPAYGAAAADALDSIFPTGTPEAGHHSASVVAVDRWGNVAALVHSSNTPLWGDSGMVVDGVPVPMPGGIYQAKLAKVAPGARIPSDMAPLILMRDGKPEAAIATIGTSLMQETARLMLGVVRGGDLATDLAAPPLLFNFEDAGKPLAARDELVPAGRYSADLLAQVRARGMPIREVDTQRTLVLRGTAVAAKLGKSGGRQAFEVPGVMGFAEAE